MTTKTFYRDVEFDVEVECNIKAKSDIVNFDHTKKEVQKVKILGETLEDAVTSFSDEVGFDLTPEQMLEVAFSDINTLRELANGHTDTCAKRFFVDVFASFVLRSADESDCRSWPEGGDSKEYRDKFFADLNEAAESLGYIRRDG